MRYGGETAVIISQFRQSNEIACFMNFEGFPVKCSKYVRERRDLARLSYIDLKIGIAIDVCGMIGKSSWRCMTPRLFAFVIGLFESIKLKSVDVKESLTS